MAETGNVGLLRVMAWSLADEFPSARRGLVALDDLANLLPTLATEAWADRGADMLACWALRGRSPPPAIVKAVLASLDLGPSTTLEGQANHWAVHALVAHFDGSAAPTLPATLRPPPGLDWEALGDWFVRTASLAIPSRSNLELGAVAPALVHSLALALLADDLVRAGALLRWLAIEPTSVDRMVARALDATLERTRPAAARAFPALAAYALWNARATKKLGDGESIWPANAPSHGPPPGLIDRALEWLIHHRGEVATPTASIRQVGELALVGDRLIREGVARGSAAWSDLGRQFLDEAWGALGRGERIRAVVEAEPAKSLGVTAYGPIFRHGLRNAALEDSFARHAPAIPRPLAYVAALSMRPMQLPLPWSIDDAFKWSIAGRALLPWRLTRLDEYLIPHIAWYEVEFAVAGEPPRSRSYVSRWLPVWLRHCERSSSYDLLAEMIVAWHAAVDGCCPAAAWDVLARVQRRDGSVPFGTTGLAKDDYHSTLMTVLAALWCRHG